MRLFAVATALAAAAAALPSTPAARPSAQAPPRPLRIIAFGAHPDDAELKASGVAALWAAAGHKVKFVAMTNGDIGHFESAGGPRGVVSVIEGKGVGSPGSAGPSRVLGRIFRGMHG